MAIAIIPARYNSTRFPGKALADIKGKPMIQRVYDRCKKSESIDRVIIATDDARIQSVAEGFGAEVVMTSESCESGTDRVFEAVEKLDLTDEIIVNVQGDEPFIHPDQLKQIVSLFEDKNTHIATLKRRIEDTDELHNNNVVKVVSDHFGRAIYFSRLPIPYSREHSLAQTELQNHMYYKHIGLYAFSSEIISELKKCRPSYLEKTESLEQLRWIENGYAITIGESNYNSHGIDSPEDIERVLALLKI